MDGKIHEYEMIVNNLKQRNEENNILTPKYEKNLLEKEIEELKKTIKKMNNEHMEEITTYANKISALQNHLKLKDQK